MENWAGGGWLYKTAQEIGCAFGSVDWAGIGSAIANNAPSIGTGVIDGIVNSKELGATPDNPVVLDFRLTPKRGKQPGVDIQVGFKDPGLGYEEYRWVQTIRTTHPADKKGMPDPTKGKYQPYNDGDGPFYWSDEEALSSKWGKYHDGYDYSFFDTPRRYWIDGTVWLGELSLVGFDGNKWIEINTVVYGFKIEGGILIPIEATIIDPSKWHLNFINTIK